MHIRPPGARPTKATKRSFLSSFSLTLYALFLVCPSASLADIWPTVFWPDPSSCPQLLLQVARSSSLDRIPSASCKVVRRSRARCVNSNCYPYFMCYSFQMAVMHCTRRRCPTDTGTFNSFFELIKRPYQAVACGHPQMSSQLGRP